MNVGGYDTTNLLDVNWCPCPLIHRNNVFVKFSSNILIYVHCV